MERYLWIPNLKSSCWDKNRHQVEHYTLDPELISLQRFYTLTRNKKLIPGRALLLNGIDKNFSALEKMGIENLKQLIAALGKKEKIEQVSGETGIPWTYLNLLKREAGSYLARPFPLSDFPGIPLEYTEVLKSKGIRNTRDFFESVQSPEQRMKISKLSGIPVSRLAEIFSLCDLSRISGVGGLYARVLYMSGIRSLRAFAETDILTHLQSYREILEKRAYPLKALGEEDLQYCIHYATFLLEINQNPDSL